MSPALRLLAAVSLLAMIGFVGAAERPEAIDWNRARELRQKQQQGATLSADERAYLQRAMAERQRAGGAPAREKGARGRAAAGDAAFTSPAINATPLTDMSAEDRYKGRDGGLYGEGRNEPPPAQAAAARAAATKITPLNAQGQPAATGLVVLLSVGMSNTTQEFSRFKEVADADPAKSKSLVIVDGAQGGQDANDWAAAPTGRIWETVDTRLQRAGATAAQVQVVWLKQAIKRPTEEFPIHAKKFESRLAQIVQMLKTKFPSLRLVYLSSRTFGGFATTPLNPEPYAFESAFAVRDLIRRQIDGDPALNFDPAKGEVRAPVLLWGPYLWANGATPRKDGFGWTREDFREDGTHPSATTGREKVAQQLLTFFKTDPTARTWF